MYVNYMIQATTYTEYYKSFPEKCNTRSIIIAHFCNQHIYHA
jgi:hypothetical protein